MENVFGINSENRLYIQQGRALLINESTTLIAKLHTAFIHRKQLVIKTHRLGMTECKEKHKCKCTQLLATEHTSFQGAMETEENIKRNIKYK